MRTIPGALKSWLDAGNNGPFRADLVTLTLLSGSVFRWTSADIAITSGGNTYQTAGASGPTVQRGAYSCRTRAEIDTLDLTLVGGALQINSLSLIANAAAGTFDGARIQIDHLLGPDLATALSFGPMLSFFEGRVAGLDPAGPALVLRLKSELDALNVLLPKFVLQPQCGHAVYDANCGLSRGAFTLSGAASGSPTRTNVPTASAAFTAKAAAYFDLGVLQMTSGTQSGSRRAITHWDGTNFVLALPFVAAPLAGDTMTAYPGCDRSEARCVAPFNNLANFRGFPKIPTAEAAS